MARLWRWFQDLWFHIRLSPDEPEEGLGDLLDDPKDHH